MHHQHRPLLFSRPRFPPLLFLPHLYPPPIHLPLRLSLPLLLLLPLLLSLLLPISSQRPTLSDVAVVTSLFPLTRPLTVPDPSYVNVTGASFNPSSLCRFSPPSPSPSSPPLTLPSLYLSPTSLSCLLPPPASRSPSTLLTLRVLSTPSSHHSLSSLTFTFSPPLTLTTPSPSIGSPQGGTTLTIEGGPFTSSSLPLCQLNSASSAPLTFPSLYLSPTSLTCTTPPYPFPPLTTTTPLTLSLSDNSGVDYAPAGAFTYVPDLSPLSLSPPGGATIGGTLLSITLSTPCLAYAVYCRVGSGGGGGRVAPAAYPAAGGVGAVVQCRMPAVDGPGDMSVALSYDPLNFPPTPLPLPFTYYTLPLITYLSPQVGVEGGGTLVNLTFASPLPPSATLLCVFGGVVGGGPAQASAEWVGCTAPAGVGRVEVGVEVDGVWVEGGWYEGVEVAQVTAIHPSTYLSDQVQTLYVTGASFTSTSALTCAFTDATGTTSLAPALYQSPTGLTCVTPASALGSEWLMVAVSNLPSSPLFTSTPPFNLTTPTLTLASLTPPSGPTLPLTLTVTGTGFTNSTTLACAVDSAIFNATYLSPTLLTCWMDGQRLWGEGQRTVWVRVRSAQGNVSVAALPYTPSPPILLTAISPLTAVNIGGTVLTLTGSAFRSDASCAFELHSSPPTTLTATLLTYTPTMVTCAVPDVTGVSGLTYPTYVAVTLTDAAFASNPIGLILRAAATVTAVTPSVGWVGWGTAVTLTGAGFVPTHSPVFSLGGIGLPSPSIYLSPTSLLLLLPSTLFTPNFTSGLGLTTTANCPSLVLPLGLVNGDAGLTTLPSPLTFTLFNTTNVSALAPTAGSVHGGTVLQLTTTPLYVSSTLRCRFDVQVVSPLSASSTSLACAAPSHTAGVVPLYFSINAYDWVYAGTFTYLHDLHVTAMTPMTALPYPPTVLTLTGSNLNNPSSPYPLTLLFNSTTLTICAPLSSQAVTCPTPALDAGAYALGLTANGVDVYATALTLTVHAQWTVTGISPASGSVAGGTVVVVSGTFTSASTFPVYCLFGADAVLGLYLSTSTLQCVAPAQAAGTVTLQVGSNAQVWTTAGAAFVYYTAPAVASIAPALGPSRGGTAVTVTGSNFPTLAPSTFTCRFASTLTAAVVLSPTSVACVAPPLLPGSHTFALSPNGADYVEGAGGWEVYAPPTLTSVSPPFIPTSSSTTLNLTSPAPLVHSSVFCRFTSQSGAVVTSSASLPDPYTVQCVAPVVASAGRWKVSLAMNGEDYDETGLVVGVLGVAALMSMAPASVSATGGAVVTVVGSGLTSSTFLSCSIGGTLTPLTFLSSTTALCLVPSSPSPGAVTLLIASATGTPFSSSLTLTYHPVVTISAPSPSTVLSMGGAVLSFTSSWVDPVLQLQCLFSALAPAPASVVSATSFTCAVPALPPSAASVVRVVSAYDLTVEFDFTFAALAPPTVLSVYPTVGTIAAGTAVTVSGLDFLSSSSCQFHLGSTSLVVAASSSTPTSLVCASPSFGAAGVANVSVTSVPPLAFSASSATFQYLPSPSILSIFPAVVPLTGDVLVTVTGTNFVPSSTLICGLNITAPAHLLLTSPALATSTSTVECVVPALSTSFASSAFSATVQVSINGIEWYASTVLLSFSPPITLTPASFAYLAGDDELLVLAGSSLTSLPSSSSLLLHCVFAFSGSSAFTLADVVSSTAIVCPLPLPPAALLSSPVIASVTVTDGVLSSVAAVWVTFFPPPVVSALSTVMPVPGSTLTIGGQSFSSSPTCLFTSAWSATFIPLTSIATALSSTEVSCIVPALPYNATSPYYVTVIPAGLTSVPFSQVFLPLFSTPQASAASTSALTSLYPSTVRVLVANVDGSYVNSPALSCTSDSGTYPAVYINASAVICLLASSLHLYRPSFALFVSNTPSLLSNGVLGYPPLTPLLSAVTPSSVSTSSLLLTPSSSAVLVTGTSFQHSPTLACLLNGLALAAVFLNSTAVSCVLSAEALALIAQASSLTATALSLPLSVTNDGVDLSIASIPIAASPSPTIASVQPSHADPTLTTTFTVVGSGFSAADVCVFLSSNGGQLVVAAVWLDAMHVQCGVGGGVLGAGQVVVSVTADVSVTPASSVTIALSTINLTSLFTTYGPDDGGALLTISGSGFLPPPAASSCVFDRSASVTATSTPLLWSSAATFVNSSLVTCLVPAHAPGNVTVDVLMDAQLSTPSLYFEFSPQLRAVQLQPAWAVVTDVAVVTVAFDSSLQSLLTVSATAVALSCAFDSSYLTPLTVLNATCGQCPLPKLPSAATYAAQLTVVDATRAYVSDPLPFTFVTPLSIAAFTPTLGSVSGGTTLTITGASFSSSPPPFCLFNLSASTAVTAVVTSTTSLTCVTPSSTAGPVSVQVCISVTGCYTLPAPFVYLSTPTVTSVPSPAYVGSTMYIAGSAFIPSSSSLTCLFAPSTTVPATYADPTHVYCTLPLLPGVSTDSSVTLAVSNDGVSWSIGVPFLYLIVPLAPLPALTSLTPLQGPPTGGTALTVTGSTFIASNFLACVIGLTSVPAVWVNSSAITCVTPAYALGVSQVAVSNDGVAFTSVTLPFIYSLPPVVTALTSAYSTGDQLVVTLTGTSFTPSSLCAFTSNTSAFYPFISSTELPELPSTIYVTPTPTPTTSTQLTCAAPPLTAFLSAATGSWGATMQVTALTSLAETVVAVGVVWDVWQGVVSALPFTYHALTSPPTITSLTSTSITDANPYLTLDITGVGFVDNDQLSCRYAITPLPLPLYQPMQAIYLSPTHILCRVAATTATIPPTFNTTVAVTVDGHQWVTGGTITFVPPPSINSLSPPALTWGATFGLYVVGSAALAGGAGGSPVCSVGGQLLVGSMVNSGTVLCVLRPADYVGGQAVAVSVSMDGWAWSNVLYLQPLVLVTLTSSFPPSGPVAGGTVVTLVGAGFTSSTLCSFHFEATSLTAAQDVASTSTSVTNSTRLLCTTPPSPSALPQRVRVQAYNSVSQLTASYPLSPLFFAYLPPVTFVSFTPTYGPVGTTVVVTVSGSGFVPLPTFACVVSAVGGGNNRSVVAVYANNGTALCSLSMAGNVTSYTLQVTVDGITLTPPSLPSSFTFIPLPAVTAVQPAVLDWSLQTLVTVRGVGLTSASPALSTSCLFDGQVAVAATVVNSTCITCLSPYASAFTSGNTRVQVQVQLGAGVSSTSGGWLLYVAPPTVTSLAPTFGPTTGGTVITLQGSHFSGATTRVLSLTSPSTTTNYTLTPSSDTLATFTLPPSPAGNVTIALSINAGDASGSPVVFTYLTPPSLTSVSPSFVPYHGGFIITVTGSSFPPSTSVCVFGSLTYPPLTTTPAHWVDGQHVVCVTPVLIAGVTPLTVTFPSLASSTSLNLTITPPPSILSAFPLSAGLTLSPYQWLMLDLTAPLNVSMACSFGGLVAVVVGVGGGWGCQCPALAGVVGKVQVEVLDDTGYAVWSSTAVYQPFVRVTAVYPAVGLNRGGALVKVKGVGLEMQGLRCVWTDGTTQVGAMAQVTNASLASCTVPSWPTSGVVTLQVTTAQPMAGSVFPLSPSSLFPSAPTVVWVGAFTYCATFSVLSLSPALVPADYAGVVTVIGAGFDASAPLHCVFASTVASPAFVLTPTSLTCAVPLLASAPSGQLTASGPVPIIGNVSVAVILGADVATMDTSSAVPLLFTPPAVIAAYAPATALAFAAFNLSVVGSSFLTCVPYTCTVTAVTTPSLPPLIRLPALYVNASALVCAVPSLGVGTYEVEVWAASAEVVPYLVASVALPLTLAVLPLLTITSVTPLLVSSAGGTPLTVTGTQLNLPCLCRFAGLVVVNATGTAPLQCIAPSSAGVGGAVTTGVEVACAHFPGVWVAPQVLLTFFTPPVVTAVTPALGVVAPTSPLYVAGTGFVGVGSLGCRVRQGTVSVSLPAVYLSPALVMCQPLSSLPYSALSALPASVYAGLGLGVVTLGVTVNGVDWSELALSLPLYAVPPLLSSTPAVTSVTPAVASTLGGQVVTVSGLHFDLLSTPASCVFASHAVTAATYINATTITCPTPPMHSPSSTTLSLSFNARYDALPTVSATASTSLPFHFLPSPTVLAIHPTSGPASGGTVVTVVGRSFASSAACTVGGVTASVQWVSPTLLLCVTAGGGVGSAVVRVTNAAEALTNRSLDWATFTYFTQPQVVAMTPSSGPAEGGTAVTIALSAAISAPSTALSCRFGSALSSLPALWVDPTHLSCISPSQLPATVYVDVSVNGVDFSVSASSSPTINFTYVSTAPPSLTFVYPSLGPTSGGTVLTLTGYSLTASPSSSPLCLFPGLASTPAIPVNTSALTCPTPPGRANLTVSLSLSLTPLGYPLPVTIGGPTFTFASPGVWTVTPTLVTTAGGTAISLTGAGFTVLTPSPVCLFDGVAVTAVVVTDGILTCAAPPFASLTLSPPYPSLCPLSVGWGAGLVADSAISVAYAPAPVVTSISPTQGVSTRLTVLGSAFLPTPSFVCEVGGLVVTAFYASPTTAFCLIPRLLPAVYPVQVTLNGVDWVAAPSNYTVLEDADVLSSSPSLSPLWGGVTLTLVGSAFPLSPTLSCLFSPPATVVPAVWVSEGEVRCVTPPVEVPGLVGVRVGDGVNWTEATTAVVYAEGSAITALTPPSTYAGLTTALTLTGLHFLASPSPAACVVDGAAAPTALLSLTSITCLAPPRTAGTATVWVGSNNFTASSTASYTVYPAPTLTTVTPPRVSQALAAQAVVTGVGFAPMNGVDLACRFGVRAALPLYPLVTALTYLTPTSITCALPTSLYPTTVNLTLVLAHTPSVQVSTNALLFTFDADYSVTSYTPTQAPYTVWTTLTITGAGFIDSPLTLCRAGLTYTTPATVLSPTTLTCQLPPRWFIDSEDSSMLVDLLLTCNAADYIRMQTPFRYLLPSDCLPGTVCPPSALLDPNATYAGLIEACPPGSQCPGTDHPTLCQPGWYQPYGGQTFCLLCPPAFYCPTVGLLWPLLCPAGFICDTFGIVNPHLTRCDGGHTCAPGVLHHDSRVANVSDAGASAIAEARAGVVHARRLLAMPASSGGVGSSVGGLMAQVAALQLSMGGVNDRALVLALLYADLAANGSVHLPSECDRGLFCLPGTGQPLPALPSTSVQLNSTLLSPLPCYPGYLCPTASVTPLGSAPCPRSFYCPDSTSAYPCPVGAYCPGSTLEPILCPPSTYNNVTAMAACIPCPLGHYCPSLGLFLPLLCPAGVTCDEVGLILPTTLCPAGYFCRPGTTTANVSAHNTTSRPHACPAQYFCLAGTQSRLPLPGNFSTPQLCTGGTYCLNATSSVLGAAICQSGAYCPPGSSSPIEASVGWFVDYLGAPIQYQCLPGSFAPDLGSASCLPCPAGYSCQTVGADVALICPKGFYHSMADLICQACPRGTFSEVRGLPDASLCQPCLPGYVCASEGLTGMDGATPCVEGYVCGEGTTQAGQYDYPCPDGFICGHGTTPLTQYDLLCPAGYTCSGGVAESESTRSVCRKGYYCPPGVYDADPVGYVLAAQCVVNMTDGVMDDFGCGAGNVTVDLPYGWAYTRPAGQCPLGTTSAIHAAHLADCFVDPAWANYPNAVWEFTPLSLAEIPTPDAGVDLAAGCPFGYTCPDLNDTLNLHWPSPYRSAELIRLNVGHMDYVVLTLDWSSLSSNLTYGAAYELLVYTGVTDTAGAEPTTIALPNGFTSSSVTQRAVLRLGFLCLSNTTLTVSLGLLHGLYLPQAREFVNTGVVSVVQPSRAVTGTRDVFMTVYDFVGRSLYQPLNLPQLSTELPYGYMLQSITLDSSVSLIVDPDAEQITEDIAAAMDEEGIGNFAFPFLPFFSDCRGYDSYINLHVLFQDVASCALVDPSQVVAVGNFDFLASPNSDTCNVQTQCLFEEDMTEVTPFPRWFDKSADQQTMFYIAQSAFDASQWESMPIRTYADLADYYADELGQDTLVAVIVNRDQNAESPAFPRQVELDIEYQQTDVQTKKIITGSVTLSSFDTDLTNASYTLTVTLTPLTYFGLVNNFVFNETIFTIIYLIIGAISVVLLAVMWLMHRITTRLHFPPNFRLSSFMRIMFPPAVEAFVLWLGFPALLSYLLWYFFVRPDTPLFASFSGNVASDLGAASFDTSQVQYYAAGRIGACLLALAVYSMWAGARMFVPERRKKRVDTRQKKPRGSVTGGADSARASRTGQTPRSRLDQVGELSDDEDAGEGGFTLEAHDMYWRPKTWKRSNFLLVSMFVCLALLIAIEFSYSNLFNQNQWPVIIGFKVAEIPINWLLRLTLQEDLLTMPHQVVVDLVQFMITVGASNFTYFIIGFAVQDVALKYVERVWKDDSVDYAVHKAQQAMRRWEKLTKSAAEQEAEQREKEELRAMGSRLSHEDAGQDEVVAPVLNSHETSEEILGPLIEFYADYSAKVISLFFSPFLMYFLYQFRAATQMTIGWNIPQHDMFFYFLFVCVLLPFMMLIDVIIINIKELTHFWKMHDYLQYLALRFQQRQEWWQMHAGGEGDIDMAVPRQVRSLDHLAFSGQYYFMILVHTGGMTFLIISMQIFIHNDYNPFNDLLALLIFAATCVACLVVERLSLLSARTFGLWPLTKKRRRVYIEQQYRGDTGIVPSWEQGYVQQIEQLKEKQWYSEEWMKTLPFKQRWVKLNREFVAEELLRIWRAAHKPHTAHIARGGKPQDEERDGGDGEQLQDDEDALADSWLAGWEEAGSREALLDKIAHALGMHENWETLDADEEGLKYAGQVTSRGREDAEDELVEGDGEGEGGEGTQCPSPYTARSERSGASARTFRSPRSSRGAHTSRGGSKVGSRHRARLMALSYRFLLSRYSHTCGVCESVRAQTVVQLKVALKVVLKRWYARKKREVAISARMDGSGAVDRRGALYARVSKAEWRQWMEEQEDWRTLCRDCAQSELERRERGEWLEGDEEDFIVVDVLQQAQREKERRERLRSEGVQPEDDSSSSDSAEPSSAPPMWPAALSSEEEEEEKEEAKTAYWHPPERADDFEPGHPRDKAGGEEKERLHEVSDDSDDDGKGQLAVAQARVDVSDDSDDGGKGPSSAAPPQAEVSDDSGDGGTGPLCASPLRVGVSDDSDDAKGGTKAPQQPRADISDDEDSGDEKGEAEAAPQPRADISDDSDDEGRAGQVGRAAAAVGPRVDISPDSSRLASPDSTARGAAPPALRMSLAVLRGGETDRSSSQSTHRSSRSVEVREEDVRHGLIGLGRLDIVDDALQIAQQTPEQAGEDGPPPPPQPQPQPQPQSQRQHQRAAIPPNIADISDDSDDDPVTAAGQVIRDDRMGSAHS